MGVLIIKNAIEEGPGNLVDFFRSFRINYLLLEGSTADEINIPDDFRYLVVLGGPMGVYEMDRYNHLKTVAKAIEYSLRKEIKILGICLGAQLLAHVLGSRVYKGQHEEIGWCDIDITESAQYDQCFSAFVANKRHTKVFQWHHDTFDLPDGATRLASSSFYSEQAFKYKNSYGIQFHPEVTKEIVVEWFNDRKGLKDIINDTNLLFYESELRARLFYKRFFDDF